MPRQGRSGRQIGKRVGTSPIGDNVEDGGGYFGSSAVVWIMLDGFFGAGQWLTGELILPGLSSNSTPLGTSW